jgi:hypothetical protein
MNEASTKGYEPKSENRFIIYCTDSDGEQIIPSFVVRRAERPSYSLNWFGRKKFKPFKLVCYDPITPSTSAMIELAVSKKLRWDFVLNLVGPVGDKVEEWEIKNAKLVDINYGTLDWTSPEKHLMIHLTFNINNAKLIF